MQKSIYTEDYINELKLATPVRNQKDSTVPPPAAKPVEDVISVEDVILQDDDILMQELSDESDGYIALDPETIAEENDLRDSRIYNEFDLEGMDTDFQVKWINGSMEQATNLFTEGVGFEDEELALDKKLASVQADLRRKEMQDAINEV